MNHERIVKTVTNDARQILARVLMAQKDYFGDEIDPFGCALFNIVLDTLGVPPDSIAHWNREEFFERWEATAADEKSINGFLDWVIGRLDPQLN